MITNSSFVVLIWTCITLLCWTTYIMKSTYYLLGCYVVYSNISPMLFQRNARSGAFCLFCPDFLSVLFFDPKDRGSTFLQKIYFYWNTRHHIPDDNTLRSPHCENLKNQHTYNHVLLTVTELLLWRKERERIQYWNIELVKTKLTIKQ
jgi:hypothetical protein